MEDSLFKLIFKKFFLPHPKFSKKIFVPMMFLLLFGTVMVISAYAGTYQTASGMFKVGIKQLVYILIGYIVYCFMSNTFALRKFGKIEVPLAIIVFISLIITIFFPAVYGSHAWIHFSIGSFSMSIQPIEFAKVFGICLMAYEVEKASHYDTLPSVKFEFNKRTFNIPTLFIALGYLVVCFFVVFILHKDKGSAIIFAAIIFFSMFVPSHPKLKLLQKIMLGVTIIAAIGFIIIMTPIGSKLLTTIFKEQYVINRFVNNLNPFIDETTGGYQLNQGLTAIANHHFSFGNSIQKYGWLTQADSDFILAIILEETSYLGLIFLIICYGFIIINLFSYFLKAKSEGYKFVFVGVIMYLMIHIILNVGGIGSLIPLTGVPLLMVSSGGTSIISIMCALGIAQGCIKNIRKQASKKSPK